MEFLKAFQQLNMPLRRYVLLYAAPMVAGGLAAAGASWFFLGDVLPGLLAPLVAVGFAGVGVVGGVLYPSTIADRRRTEINEAIPFFMTHFGVLSTSNMPRADVIRILGEKKEYKALAGEMERIHGLVSNWNLSLPEACRSVAASSPSQILSDFLERLAHALETGQDLEAFLRSEQSVVMKEYATVYETAVYRLEQLKEIYLSTMMSGVFLVIFSIITPVITGSNPARLLMGILLFFVFMEILFLFLIKFRAPNDRLWHRLDIPTVERQRIQTLLAASVLGAVVLGFTLVRFTSLPFGVALAAGVTPLAATGLFAEVVEKRIQRREDNYSAFIRSLGSSAAARGGSMREVLRKLQHQNFGPLTQIVHNLFARLTWRIQDLLAWKHFSAESGSNLVENFNDMFIEGIRAGGKPDAVGSIISDNVVRILNLRKSRYATAATFRGVLFGFTAAMGFTLFIGVAMLDVLDSMFAGAASAGDFAPLNLDFAMDTGVVTQFLFWLLLFHALVAAIIVKLLDGGDIPAGLTNFVVLVWMGVVISMASTWVMGSIFGLGPHETATAAAAVAATAP